MNTLLSRLARGSACLTTALAVAGCGGGGASAVDAPTSTASTALTLGGSSASTVSLAWTQDAGVTSYTLARRGGDGSYQPVAELAADVHQYLDEGLAPHTAYTYRLTTHRGNTSDSAEGTAATTDDALEVTPAGALIGDAGRAVIGGSGGTVASASGALRVDVPAGTWTGDGAVVLQDMQNTAPGGVGTALRVSLPARPAKPLTLTMTYGEQAAPDADGLGVALQRRDGSWLALPLKALDRGARRITLELPPSLLPTKPAASLALAHAAAADADVELTASIVKLMFLSPRSASLHVGETQRFVPYLRTTQTEESTEICVDGVLVCVVTLPVVSAHQAPFLNSKPGYTRQWRVQGVEGGSAALGTVQAQDDVGGLYTAPRRAPTPNPVKVSFRSRNDKSGRTIELSADVVVAEPVWTGIMHGTLDGAVDLGFSFSAEAVWTLDPASDDQFHASGTQSVHVINITCSASASPSTVPLPPGLLKIDRSSNPVRYTLDIGSLWNTTIAGTCPGRGGTSVPMVVPGQLQAAGSVSADGTRIEGTAHFNNIQWDWSFTSQLQP